MLHRVLLHECKTASTWSQPLTANKNKCLRFLNRELRYTYVIRNNKIQTFFNNNYIALYCQRYDSNNQVLILRKTCTCSYIVHFLSTLTRLLILMHKTYHKTVYKSLPDDETWLYRNRVEDIINHQRKKCAFCWFLLHMKYKSFKKYGSTGRV